MAIPASGVISLSTVQTEFGGANPISINEYYAGGTYVPAGTSGTYGAVPSSGTISLQNFYGTAAGYTYWYLNQTSSAGNSKGASGIDGSGNLYTANNGSSNAPTFTKVATLGAAQFSRRFTSGYYAGMATAPSGNSYISGSQGSAGFVVKYNSSGTLQWQRSVSSASGSVNIDAICVDPSENVYILGTDTNGPVTFLICFDSSGTKLWGRQISTGGAVEGRTAISYYDAGTSTGVVGLFIASTGSYNGVCAFTYSTAGTYNGGVSLGDVTRSVSNNYIGVAYASPYFAFTCLAYNAAFTTTYQTTITFDTNIGWQKELTNGGLTNYNDSIATDGSNFYTVGASPSDLNVVKFSNSGTVSSQRLVTAVTGLAASVTSDGSVLSIGVGAFGAGSFLVKAPLSMAFGSAGSRTATTSTYAAAPISQTDSIGTQTTATSAYTEAAYTSTQTLTQLT